MTNIKYGGDGSSYEWTEIAFPKPFINSTSLAVTPIEILDCNDQICAHGSSFVYIFNGSKYLVTAWHNISGKNFFTRERNPNGLIPIKFIIYKPGFEQNGTNLKIMSNSLEINLDEDGLKIIDSPPNVFGADVDIAVLLLSISDSKFGKFSAKGLDDFTWGIPAATDLLIRTSAGSDVFLLGYPLDAYSGQKTPIWKRGIISNEPTFSIEPKCSFLIDVNSARGMSGGPIVRRVTTAVFNNLEDGVIEEGFVERILGVYSGRVILGSKSDIQSDSGFVLGYGWPIDIVNEIINSQQSLTMLVNE